MILQALNRYYDLLLETEGDSMPREQYSSADVSFEVYLDDTGRVNSVIPYVNDKGKNTRRTFNVPKQAKRAGSGINPYFLCDKPEYLFGSAISLRESCREGMIALAKNVLKFANTQSPEITALHAFLDCSSDAMMDHLSRTLEPEFQEVLVKGGLCVLKYAMTGKFFHNDPHIQFAWERYHSSLQVNDAEGSEQICLITGEKVSSSQIARLHPNIKNVVGAQSAGASIVSFNIESFESYGKKQSYNAPTSQKAAEAYGFVLNKFMSDPNHRVRMNDTTVVFWAETTAVNEQVLLSSLFQDFGDDDPDNNVVKDADSIRTRVKSAVLRVREGQAFKETFEDMDENAKFYVLGISPNAARLSIRFWYTGTLGEIGEQVWKHYEDLAIVGLERSPTIRTLLRETAVGHDWKNIPPNTEGQMLRSILLGLPYSRAIFAGIMNRIRADKDDPKKQLYKIGALRAALIKAYLLRRARINNNTEMEGEITMALNEQSTSVPYHLGRLFACLEKTQSSALGLGINTTIRDRFWGAASATPATVFPRLLSLSQHHISKDEQWGRSNDKKIQEVMNALPEKFPNRLSLEEQGMFALGYYHQRQSLYTTKDNN